MHEMSLTESILDMLEEESRRQGFSRVRRIWLELGALGHVSPEAMTFCFDAVARGTLAEGARLEFLQVEARGRCDDCGRETPLVERFGACVHCGSRRVRMTAGQELRVKELEVE